MLENLASPFCIFYTLMSVSTTYDTAIEKLVMDRNDNNVHGLTIEQVFDCHPDALVKAASVGRGVERQPKLLVACLPVVEGGHHFVVLKVLLDRAAQHNLQMEKLNCTDERDNYWHILN